jgi:4-alpha-glucanotransferase
MKVKFNIHYSTQPGQSICISGSENALGKWDYKKAVYLNYHPHGNWSVELNLRKTTEPIEYKYFVIDDGGNVIWELGKNRTLALSNYEFNTLHIHDTWFWPNNSARATFSSAFTHALMKRTSGIDKPFKLRKMEKGLQFNIQVPRIGADYKVCVLGNQTALGNWKKEKALVLECGNDFPNWKGAIPAGRLKWPIIYKYGIIHIPTQEVVTIEEGEDRRIDYMPLEKNEFAIKSDEHFHYPVGNWKGAGVAIPVFSLRTENSFGVGEFTDLIDFMEWAKSVDLKMLQILPINDTIAKHTWLDSYPYKAISVTALHPMYLNLKKMGTLKDAKKQKEFDEIGKKLNKEIHVDYLEMMKHKSAYYKLLYDQDKDVTLKSKGFKEFFADNEEWLKPYAAFSYLRDKYKTADFRKWGKNKKYSKAAIDKMCKPTFEFYDDIAIHMFIQYHLHLQLKEAADFARDNGIVLKGDIPIGISPNSVEAWTDPHLFNLNGQAGAPPDDFSALGQNWGFPTYNWEVMAKDNFLWWRKRLQKMAEYFEAYRIDHILGFFRIWEIPLHAVEGILGYFKPAIAMGEGEIQQYGIGFDRYRFTKPYIREHLLGPIFGEYTDEVKKLCLNDVGYGVYELKEDFDTQLKVNEYFLDGIEEEDLEGKNKVMRDGLFSLISNVLFLQSEDEEEWEWHPRIGMHHTSSYAELDDYTKSRLNDLYIHYFYKRHDDFWYHSAMRKLPAIVEATDMLVCGEDLGMVPGCVPPVMDQMGLLSLEIQRMPKDPEKKFAHPADAPYLSVCTTSTHDMSTIRGYWEEDREVTQDFFINQLGNYGEAPFYAETYVCKQMINQHLYSPAMWTTFPLQDLLAMDDKLRWAETHLERINEPANVRHKWRYRMHMSVEELKEAKEFNDMLAKMIDESGRKADY